MDENVHGAITIGLRLREIDVLTVQEDGYSGVDDLKVTLLFHQLLGELLSFYKMTFYDICCVSQTIAIKVSKELYQ